MTGWRASTTFAAALVLAACGGQSLNEDGDDGGEAGESTGGRGGSARGGSDRGGTAGVNTGALGGTPGVGGSSSGAPATGGRGGSVTGGVGGSVTGGVGGTGRGGGAGADSCSTLRYTFETSTQGFVVEYTASGMTATGDLSPVIDTSAVLLEHTNEDGDPATGALEVTIPYTSESQYVGIGVNFATALDLSGCAVSLHVKLASGLSDPLELMTNPGGVKLYAKSGVGYCYANGSYNNITVVGSWMTVRFDMSRPPDYVDPECAVPFDPAEILELGVQFDTGSMTETARTAVVRIDTLAY